MPATRQLAGLPALPALYARAVAGSALVKLRPRRGLPETGETLEVRGLAVDPRELTRFQHLSGDVARDAVPVGYLHILGFPLAMAVMTSDSFPLPVLGSVHVANRIRLHRLPQFDEPLDVRVRVSRFEPHRRGTLAVLEVTVSTGGETILVEESDYLSQGVRILPDAPVDVAPREEFSPPTPTGLWHFSRGDVDAYTAVSGDANPIHTSTVAAKAFGFAGTIVHGMFAAARAITVHAPGEGPWSWDIAFQSPIPAPGKVAVARRSTGRGSSVDVWNPRSGKPSIRSRVVPGIVD